MRRGTFSVLLAVVAIACGFNVSRATAQTPDRLLGTWVMDANKSTFSGNAPNKRTMKFETVSDGIRHTTDTVTTAGLVGESYRLEYTFKIDGKDYPADPAMPLSTVSFKRVDANTVERQGKYRDEIVETVKYVVSPDGKRLTVNQRGTLNGADVSSQQIFTRQ